MIDIQNDEGYIYFDLPKKEPKNIDENKNDQKEVQKVDDSNQQSFKKKIIRPRLKSLGKLSDLIGNPPESSEKISITFIFSQKSTQIFCPFNFDANLNDTIKELSKIIVDRFDIKDKVKLQCKYPNVGFVTIDKEMSLNDVKNEIVEVKNGEKRNIIYILVKPKK